MTNAGIATIPGAETEAGAPLGDITAFFGTSTTGVFSPSPCESFAKPAVYPMHPMVRGTSARIDPNKYRILTAEMGLPNKPRDLCGGSIVRVVWWVAGEASENYSWGIPLNSRAGANVVNRINLDLAALPIDPASPSHSGWTPGLSAFPGIAGLPPRSARVREPDRLLHQTGQAGSTGEGRIELHRALDVQQGRRHRACLLRHRSRPDQPRR